MVTGGYVTWAGSGGGQGREERPGLWTSSSHRPRTQLTVEEVAMAPMCTKNERPHPWYRNLFGMNRF